jgi:uncharacterized membrane protein YfhO
MQVYNMLNVKYFILPGDDGKELAQQNPDANGNVWFVNEIRYMQTANEEIKALDSLNTKEVAVLRDYNPYGFEDSVKYNIDTTATIKLTEYSLNALAYKSFSSQDNFAVFSEIYYKEGWNAYIDGKFKPHISVNYVLRGMEIPAGRHLIEFKFEPKVIQTGSTISLISYVLLVLIPLCWFFLITRKKV